MIKVKVYLHCRSRQRFHGKSFYCYKLKKKLTSIRRGSVYFVTYLLTIRIENKVTIKYFDK